MLHFLCHRSQGYGAGNIRGSILILSTRIQEQKSFRLQRCIRFGWSFIMNDGTMSLVACNRIKGNITEQILLCTQGGQLPVDRHLRLSSSLNSWNQPFQEFNHGNTITKHRSAIARNFSLALHSLHCRDRRSLSHYFLALHRLPEIIACFVAIQKNIILRILLQSIFHLIIII